MLILLLLGIIIIIINIAHIIINKSHHFTRTSGELEKLLWYV